MILEISIGILILIALMLLNIVTVSYDDKNILNYNEQSNNLNKSKNKMKNNKNNNLNNNQNNSKSNDIGKYNPKSLSQGLYGLPEKDPYMSELMKQQINSLSTKYYYDNCKYIEK